jgi:uncharacterized protein YndB with AHSA1/START domain
VLAMTTTTLTRTYPATAARIWALWTTPEGIQAWWAPDGFETEVRRLDLRPGGELVYAMTATAPEQAEFMTNNGMPLTTVSHKAFTELSEPTRIAYTSLVDFVPDVEPYEHLTTVDLVQDGDATTVTMTVEPLHDDVWTQRLLAGRAMELDHLGALLGAGAARPDR